MKPEGDKEKLPPEENLDKEELPSSEDLDLAEGEEPETEEEIPEKGAQEDKFDYKKGYKDIQAYKTQLEEERVELRRRLAQLEKKTESAQETAFDPQEWFTRFQRDPRGAIQEIVGPSIETVEERTARKEIAMEIKRLSRAYPDFNDMRPEMTRIIEEGLINARHPEALESAYKMVKAGREKGSSTQRKSPPPTEKGTAGTQKKTTPDYAKMTFDELEKIVTGG